MGNVALHSVYLEGYESCLVYAAKRLGIEDKLPKVYEGRDAYLDKFLKLADRREYREGELKTGDILIWDEGCRVKDLPTLILASGIIVSSEKTIGIHAGVYEGGDLFSELVRLSGQACVQMKRVKDYKPDTYMRIF